jgi:ACS family hexuronate transporter-like MFS transporter
MGQAGSWAASVKAVAIWFPKEQRGMANSVWGAGTSAGLVLTVPLVASLTVWWGWNWAFLITGVFGLLWTIVWWLVFRLPEEHPRITTSELELLKRDVKGDARDEKVKPPSFATLLRWRNVWAMILARALADPIAWFYHYWTPEFLRRSENFSMTDIGRYAWIPFLTQTIGILIGGTLSDLLLRKGMPPTRARLTIMLAGMIMMTAGLLAAFSLPIVVVFSGISLATFGFGLWAPNMMSLCGELFPRNVIGSVTGLSGMGAGLGGVALTLATGWMVEQFGYSPVFVTVSIMPLLAFAVLYILLKPEIQVTNSQD